MKINRSFAEAVISKIMPEENTIVWVHDYPLSLVPKLIKKQKPDAKVSFYWYIPWSKALNSTKYAWLKNAIDCADVVGVNTINDKKRHAAGKTHSANWVSVNPLSIDKSFFKSGTIQKSLRKIRVLSIDRTDYAKGIVERLDGIEKFLDKNPEFLNKAEFLQILVPSRLNISVFRKYYSSVLDRIARINNKFHDFRPIKVIAGPLTQKQLIRQYQLADACIISSIKDGMNLVSKEYVASRKKPGVLLLSEGCGSAYELKEAIIFNPRKLNEFVRAIRLGLIMSKTEKTRRWFCLKKQVREYGSLDWGRACLNPLLLDAPIVAERTKVVGVYEKGGKILLVKNKGNYWYSLPGGGVNANESPENALKREFKEELGASIVKPTFFSTFIVTASSGKKHAYILFKVKLTKLKPTQDITSAYFWNPADTRIAIGANSRRIIQAVLGK